MNSVLSWIGVVLIAVLGGLFAVPHVVDFNRYRGVFEEEASRVLGREVRVGGPVNVRFLPTPYVSFEKVRIADTTASLGEPIFKAESFRMWLSVPPLLRGVVEANDIELKSPVIRLMFDGRGGGNWQTLAVGNAAYLPREVSLQSVRISGGIIAFHNDAGDERTRIENISGELASPTIEGPYRFRGTYGNGPALRDVRLSTARPETDGAVRFKSQIKQLETGTSYAIDARLVDVANRPRLEGELVGQFPIAPPAPPPGINSNAEGSVAELRATLKADPNVLQLSDLSFMLEQGREPQIITGAIDASWRDALAIKADLSAKWLDLDRMTGNAAGQGPIASAHRFLAELQRLLPADAATRATVTIDQAVLGGDSISNIKASIGRDGERLVIDELSANLPGASRGELRGAVTGAGDTATLAGSLNLRGASIARFATWMTGGQAFFDAQNDGGFGVVGDVATANGTAAARNLVGELAGTTVAGEIAYGWAGRRTLSAQLTGPKLDISPLVSSRLTIGGLMALVSGGGAKSGASPAASDLDARISIRTAELLAADRRFRNVAAEIEYKGGTLKMPLIQVEGDGGAMLEFEGDLQNNGATPKGTVRGLAVAKTPAALRALTELLDLPPDLAKAAERLGPALPMRLAGTVKLGDGDRPSTHIALDGELAATRISATARVAATPENWKTSTIEAAILLSGTDATRVLAAVTGLPTAKPSAAAARSKTPETVRINVTGTAKSRIAITGRIEGEGLNVTLDGQVEPEAQEPALTGDLTIKAADGARALALLPGFSELRLSRAPVDGVARILLDPQRVHLDDISGTLGGSAISGLVRTRLTDAGLRLEANLKSSELRVATLLAPLLERRPAAIAAASAAVSGQETIWSDDPFDFSILDSVTGAVRLETGRLELTEGASLGKAALLLSLGKDRLELRSLDGKGLGGTWSSAMKLDRQPAGATLTGLLRLNGGMLDTLIRDAAGKPLATGAANGVLTFAGRGLSPRAVVASLTGTGSVDLETVRFSSLTPATIRSVSIDVLKADTELMFERLQDALKSARGTHTMTMLPRRIAAEFADGLLKLAPVTIDSSEGKVAADARLDLQTLRVHSTWRIETSVRIEGRSGKAADMLPAVVLAYAGPIGALGRIEPRIASDALARELSVRRMERDVEELERLRRADEDRAREEADRRQKEEAARQSALGQPAPDVTTSPNPAKTLVIPPFVTEPPVPAGALPPAAEPAAAPDTAPNAAPPPVVIRPAQRPNPNPAPKWRPLDANEMKRLFGG